MSNPQYAAIRHAELLKIVPLGRHQIRRLENAGKFPKRFKLSDNSVAWVRSEVDDWLRARIGRPITVSDQGPSSLDVEMTTTSKAAESAKPKKPAQAKPTRKVGARSATKAKNAQPQERPGAL